MSISVCMWPHSCVSFPDKYPDISEPKSLCHMLNVPEEEAT